MRRKLKDVRGWEESKRMKEDEKKVKECKGIRRKLKDVRGW